MAKSSKLESKKVVVQEIEDKIKKAHGIVFSSYQGLTAEEDTELRKSLREAGVEYKVYKNTLETIAVKNLGYDDVAKLLAGPMSIALSYDDPVAPARVMGKFAKNHEKLVLKGGIVEGKVCDQSVIKQLENIPSKEALIGRLLGSFKAPISKFACVLNAIKDKKENETETAQ